MEQLNEKELSAFLSEGGSLSLLKESYEMREGQLALVKEICKCYNENIMGAFEAGTGIGKSFAYLLPSIKWAYTNKKRVVISTATINLQNQLIKKDIPIAFKMLDLSEKDLKVALVKGRNNYICLRKLEEKINSSQFLQKNFEIADLNNEKKEISILYNWANKTQNGDKEDLQETISDELWQEVSSETGTCMGSFCPHFLECFVTKMKQMAEEALIIVANHHVLFADIKIKIDDSEIQNEKDSEEQKKPSFFLPPFKYIVFDEAHSIKKTAINSFSNTISKKEIKKYLSLLYLKINMKKKVGIIVDLSYSIKEVNLKEFEKLHNLFLEDYLELENFTINISTLSPTLAITDIYEKQTNILLEKINKFYQSCFNIIRYVAKVIDVISEKEEFQEKKYTLSLILKKLIKILNIANSFLKNKEIDDTVFWWEKRKTGSEEELYFIQTPLNVASILKTYLFSKLNSSISVSATLQVGKTFAYYLNGVGLHENSFSINQQYFPSPFSYEKNVLLTVVQDLPLPIESSFQTKINEAIVSLIEATNGRALVLFTSYSSLKEASTYAKKHIKGDILIYAQGDETKSILLNNFKTNISACLFATMSFWEGIDVPGEALTHLILVKLPFMVPNHPIINAQAKALEVRGFNSFMCLNIPEAVILFKQGFGRLIRSNKDRGIVTILDKRLITKQYGKFFLNSIPKSQNCFATLKKIIYTIKEFIK